MRARFTALLVLVLTAVCAVPSAVAQTFPRKPIKLIVPFPPGGTPDMLARILGQQVSQIAKQQVIIDNRPGAAGNVAMELVARAAPDGYTLIMGTIGTLSINPYIYKTVGFDVARDYAPVMNAGSISNLLAVHPSVPVNSVKELVDLARKKPLTYASSGFGSSLHITSEYFQSLAGIDLQHVPYKGSALAVTALVGGETNVMFDNMPSIAPHIVAGKLKPLAVTGPKRSHLFPNVPTMRESGFPDVVVTPWYGILAPVKTPPEVVARLNALFNEAMRDSTVQKRYEEMDVEPGGGTPAQFGDLIRTESAKWSKLVRDKKIVAE